MDTVLTLIGDYGTAVYVILYLYCALKSSALPLFGGYAAMQGVLDPVLVSVAALAGGYLGDELRFGVARRYGTAWESEKPRLAVLMRHSEQLLKRYAENRYRRCQTASIPRMRTQSQAAILAYN